MSTLSSDDHLSPHNPLYYAPRRLREGSHRSSASFAETRSERVGRPTSTLPVHDALLEDAVAQALRHPLDPEVIHEPPGFASEGDRRKSMLGVAGRFAAAVGVAAIVALFFVIMIPASQDHAQHAEGSASPVSAILASFKAAFDPSRHDDAKPVASEFEKILATSRTEQPVTHEQSETLLKQFLKWQGKPTQTQ